jgi:enterochelin esterase-like enzyme
MGTRVPLAVRWGNNLTIGKQVDEFVSLTDMAPTFLEAAGVKIPAEMTGKSLLSFITKGEDNQSRDQIFFGKERHVPSQEAGDWEGYPSRAVRIKQYAYIKNFNPNGWPAGTPDFRNATFFPSYYGDVDGGPTRTYMIENKSLDSKHETLFDLAFSKRPSEELYDMIQDPDQLQNLAEDPDYNKIKEALEKTNDPRVVGSAAVFSSTKYTGGSPYPDHFISVNSRYATEKIEAFPSKIVQPRTIEILMPVKVHHDERFPVLYMMDGQNLFHPHPGWGGGINQGWRVDEVLDSLFQAGSLGKVIVVGIYNLGAARGAEYMPEKPHKQVKQRIRDTNHEWYKHYKEMPPQSDAFLQFLVGELKPFIDSNYMTIPDRANTFVAGSSMGGLISAYAICEYPEIFGGAACLSTHWPPLEGVFVEYIKNNLPDPATHKIYFDHGTEGLDAEYRPYQLLVDAAMTTKGYQQDINWKTIEYKGAKHHEDDWYARLHVPLKFLISEQ